MVLAALGPMANAALKKSAPVDEGDFFGPTWQECLDMLVCLESTGGSCPCGGDPVELISPNPISLSW